MRPIESDLLPQSKENCAAFGKSVTGCCAAKPIPTNDKKNKKNGTKVSSGSMIHLSVGAGIGAGIMALMAGLV